MFRSNNILWITLTFCVTTGSCTVFVQKSGGDIIMDCPNQDVRADITWKFNNNMLIGQSSKGILRRGKLDTSNKARIIGTSLKISPLNSGDVGTYTCGSSTYNLYVASAHANPSLVLHSSKTTLHCDAGAFDGTFWWSKNGTMIKQGKNMVVESVTSDEEWRCIIKNSEGKEMLQLEVKVSVVGPLITSQNVTIREGGDAELSCSLPKPSKLPITGGTWRPETSSGVIFPALIRTKSGVQWNSTGVNADKVIISNKNPDTDFNVTLKKVKLADAGSYVCHLEFGGGNFLNAKLQLTVSKRDGFTSDGTSEGPQAKTNAMWHKVVWGVRLWIWIAVAASSFVLINLVIIALLIHRRNKRMKRKVKRLKSMQKPLTSRNYCKCDRTASAVRTARQPGTGKRERPPPLPRHQYSSLNQ